jgi:hypothetical protein
VSKLLDDFLAKLDTGWQPVALPPAEELRRVRLLIEGCINKMLDCCPTEARAITAAMKRAASLDELRPWIDGVSARVEEQFPGLVAATEKLVEREKQLSSEVA